MAEWIDACGADDIDEEEVIRFETPPACENLATYPTKIENGRVFVQI